MPLTLVLGPANSAKAGEVLGAHAAAAPRGALLIVPTAVDVRHYGAELAEAGAVFAPVLTFSGLARVIAQRTGHRERVLTEYQRGAVLARAVAGARLETLAASAAGGGFPGAVGALIAELTRTLVTPARFVAALRAWGGTDPDRAGFAAELGRLYQGYRRELERIGSVDRDLHAWRALDALRAEPSRWGRDALYFYGFDELTPLERDAVETLARVAGAHVTVSLSYEPGRAALVARARAVEELRPLADEIRELPARDDYYAPTARFALHQLERRLFEPDGPTVSPGDAVTLLESGGLRAEAELVAAQILGLLADGMPAAEIAVVYRRRSAAGVMRRVLAEYGVPAGGRPEVPFSHSPLGFAVTALARCALGDEAGAENLLAYLRAPGVLERAEVADGLEARLARAGQRTLGAARAALGWELRELDELAAAPRPAECLLRIARRLLSAPHRGQAAVLDPLEELDARALAELERALAELEEVAASPTQADLLELLEGLIVPARATPGPDQVVLAEPLEIRARRFRVVFVCGLQEGEFPHPERTDPFLPEERRRELAAASGLLLPLPEDALERERYLFYATVSRATERVVLSYRSSDEEGNLALPSPFIADVQELFGREATEPRERRLLAHVTWDPEAAPTERERARAQASAAAPPAGEPFAADRRLGLGALGRMRHTEILSAGALEAYGECPVRWLVERELRPGRLEPEPEPMTRGNVMHAALERLLSELDGPVTTASLGEAEALLARLLGELGASQGGARPGPGVGLGAGQPEIVRAGLLRGIEAELRRYLRHEAAAGGGWRPLGLELRFGFEAEAGDAEAGEAAAPDGSPSLPALELGGGSDRVRVRGMIDRVDVATDGSRRALVRDYKSGTPRPEYPAARWSADHRLQVALYLIVVRELVGLEPVAGLYQPLRGEDIRGRGMFVAGTELGGAAHPRDARSAAEFDAELEAAAERAVTLAGALRSGELTPCPQNCSRDGCAFPAICRS